MRTFVLPRRSTVQQDTIPSKNYISLSIAYTEIWLLPEKAIYLPQSQTLALSDIHFGKAGHFRKNGIPVTRSVFEKDLFNLKLLMDQFSPRSIIFIGDLFHSKINQECVDVLNFIKTCDCRLVLVAGNHDVHIHEKYLLDAGFTITDQEVLAGGLHLVHDPEDAPADTPFIAGHIHPVMAIRSKYSYGRTPCFYLKNDGLILPAFGSFTGGYVVEPGPGIKLFPVAGNKVYQLG